MGALPQLRVPFLRSLLLVSSWQKPNQTLYWWIFFQVNAILHFFWGDVFRVHTNIISLLQHKYNLLCIIFCILIFILAMCLEIFLCWHQMASVPLFQWHSSILWMYNIISTVINWWKLHCFQLLAMYCK